MIVLKPKILIVVIFAAVFAVKIANDRYAIPTALLQIVSVGLSVGAGYALGWFLSPKAKAARNAIKLAAFLLLILVALGDRSVFGMSVTYLLGTIGFLLALGYWIGSVAKTFLEKPTTFGSAEWATLPYLEEHGLVGTGGIRIGSFPAGEKQVPLHYTGDRHLLTIAPTRTGKGTTAIIPNLLTYEGSVMVIDPKGENALITASRRAQMSQIVHVVDPWNIASGGRASRFNPLDWLVDGDIDITENAMLLADALVVPDGTSDKFWNIEAVALLQGLILYVATDPRERETRNLARVRDLLLLDGEDMPQLFQRMLESSHHVVVSTGARSLQKDEKLLSGVIATAQSQTAFLDSPRIRESLSASDFRFEDLKTKNMTIYLVLPVDRLGPFGRWLRLLIQQAITVNARNIAMRPKKPILFILDEMPALGRLSMLEQAFSLMAGFGMQLWGIVQDASQLRQLYGEAWEGFVANSGVIFYLGSRDRMTAEYCSSLCGITTIWNLSSAISRTFSQNHGSNGGGSNSESSSQTSAVAQRKLAFPDELMRLNRKQQLVLIDNHHPIMGIRSPWYQDDMLKELGVNLYARKAGQ